MDEYNQTVTYLDNKTVTYKSTNQHHNNTDCSPCIFPKKAPKTFDFVNDRIKIHGCIIPDNKTVTY